MGIAAAAVAFGAFGTAVALFALVLHRQASLARKWPVVTGTIKLSDIEQYRAAPQDGRRAAVMYQRKVSYTYKYNNLSYTNAHATPRQQRRVDLKLAGAQIHDRLQGRRQREGLGQPGKSVASHARAARGLCVGVMAGQPRRSGAWRITPPCTV